MTKRTVVIGALILAVALGLASYASPYRAIHQLRAAAETGDAEALSRYVDFPSVREGLKADIFANVMQPMLTDPKMKENPFAGLGVMLAGAMIGPMVDMMVSPSGISSMVRGKPPRPKIDALAGAVEPVKAETQATDTVSVRMRQGYDDYDHFSVKYEIESVPPQTMALIFRRDGFFDWRLVIVRLPFPNGATSGSRP